MSIINIQDNLRITDNSKLIEMFTATETIIFSGEVQKINKKKHKQLRKIVITTESIYSVRDENFFTSIFSGFGGGGRIRRRIDITKIKSLVYARLGNEFVLHVPDEFDWRIIDTQKDQIIDYILYALNLCGVPEIQTYFSPDVELHKCTLHQSEKKKGITKTLTGEPKMMSLETWREFVNEKIWLMKEDADNTEILINFLNTYNLVTLNDFDIEKIVGKGGFATVYKAQHRDSEEFYA